MSGVDKMITSYTTLVTLVTSLLTMGMVISFSPVVVDVISIIIGSIALRKEILLIPRLQSSYLLRKFEKKYPDFNTDIDVDTLERVLGEYKSLSVSKSVKKPEEYVSKNQSNFRKGTNKEKEFLELAKETIIQMKAREELSY